MIRHIPKGMTLVESVVIVACLTVGVGVILPALANVSSISKQERCLANLRRIGYANMVYSVEDPSHPALPVHHRFYLQDPQNPSFIGAYEWGGKSGIGWPGYTDGPDTGPDAFVSSKYGTKIGVGPGTRPLNRILYGDLPDYTDAPGEDYANWRNDTLLDLPIYQCPSDTLPPEGAHCPDWLNHPERSSYDHFGTSYAANVVTQAPGSGGPIESNSPYLRPMADVPEPAQTIAFMENNGRWAWAVRETPSCTWIGAGVFPEGTITGWHGKKWTYSSAFMDGHAEFIYMNSHRGERGFEDANLQEQLRCTILRGEGWRLDTHPAEVVPTGLLHDGNGRASYEGCVATE